MLELKYLPKRQGIYFFYLPKLATGYLGESKDIRKRYLQHLLSGGKREIKDYEKQYDDLEFMVLEFTDNFSAKERRTLEALYIKKYLTKGINLLNSNLKNGKVLNYDLNDSKEVLQFTLEGNFVKKHTSMRSAAKDLGMKSKTSISQACDSQYRVAYNHFWFYAERFTKEILLQRIVNYKANNLAILKAKSRKGIPSKKKKKIDQFSLSGEFIKTWSSLTEAAKALNIWQGNISPVLKNKKQTCGGYVWKYHKEI